MESDSNEQTMVELSGQSEANSEYMQDYANSHHSRDKESVLHLDGKNFTITVKQEVMSDFDETDSSDEEEVLPVMVKLEVCDEFEYMPTRVNCVPNDNGSKVGGIQLQQCPPQNKPQLSRTKTDQQHEIVVIEENPAAHQHQQLQNNRKLVLNVSHDVIEKLPIGTWKVFQLPKKNTVENPYKCLVCDKQFRHSQNLKIHAQYHTGERPFRCQVCQKEFKYPGDLKVHSRAHTGEKSYKCDVCKKAFAHQSVLTNHLRIHTGEKPYKCNVCDKEFTQSYSLTKHMRVHTGEKPYECQVCMRSFTQRSGLTAHSRMHTGET